MKVIRRLLVLFLLQAALLGGASSMASLPAGGLPQEASEMFGNLFEPEQQQQEGADYIDAIVQLPPHSLADALLRLEPPLRSFIVSRLPEDCLRHLVNNLLESLRQYSQQERSRWAFAGRMLYSMLVFRPLSTFLSGGTSGLLTELGNILQPVAQYVPWFHRENRWRNTQLIILCLFLLQRFMSSATASAETV